MTSQYRRTEVLRQYALVCQPGNCPDGIYVSPSPSVEDEWSAVIFLHKGPYAGSVLRFRIVFPAAFPARAPSVYFAKGSLIHPLVDPRTDKLLLAAGFPSWDIRSDNVSSLLFFIKGMFKRYNMQRLTEGLVANTEAWRLFQSQPNVFLKLAAQCAAVSSAPAALFTSSTPADAEGMTIDTGSTTGVGSTVFSASSRATHSADLNFRALDEQEMQLLREALLFAGER